MSVGEYVVIQVRSDKTGGEWLDYGRTSAGQARVFLGDKASSTYRAKHWVTGELLDSDQLKIMDREPHKRYEFDAPKGVTVWEFEREVLGEALLNALLESDMHAWSDYFGVVDTFKLVATPGQLKLWQESGRD